MVKLLVFIGISLFFSAYSFAQTLPELKQKLETWQHSKMLDNASVGIAVYDAQTGESLVKSDPQLSLVPASILKVVTTATALEVFGPDYRFKTTLSYSGTVKNDTLFGDLQVIGGGDPTLGSMYFPETGDFLKSWVNALKNKSIRVVSGRLVVDSSVYEKVAVPGSWVWEDLGNYYGAGASGISVFDNLFEIHLKSPEKAGQPATVLKVAPEIPGLDLQTEVLSSDVNSDQSYVFGNPEDSRRAIRGTIPKGRSDFVVKASIPDPSVVLASEFRTKLRKSGIEILNKSAYESVRSDGVMLKETFSPSLAQIIRVTNFESVNLFAEHFLKQLAWQKTGVGTIKDGCQFVADFWNEKGLTMNGFFLNDGSGLSRFNAITGDQMCWILNYMKSKSAYVEAFVKSLPAAGFGTLTSFSPENFPESCLRAKSGSMTRVRCFAGYLKTDSGRNLSFAIMLNNFSCTMKEATQKIEELLQELKKI